MPERRFDLVLFGATGFTGQLVAQYLLGRYGVGENLRWALAGRNRSKLESVRDALQGSSPKHPLPLLEADGGDAAAMAALAMQSRTVCSTVGPYAKHGTALVAACAAQGTDYCDLSGEVPWVARMINDYQSIAEDSGARIVHSCGFDSIPSDLGNWFTQEALHDRCGVYASRVRGRVGKTRGAASGGTIASLMGVAEEAQKNAQTRRRLRDKYWLYPVDEPPGPPVTDQLTARFDPCFEQWTTPFVMAVINERVVRRSNALLDFRWGRDFDYDESQLCKNRVQAMAINLGMAGALLGAANPLTRGLFGRLLPKPGEGPDRQQRESGYFELFFHAEHPSDPDQSVRTRVTGDQDPGYGATSRMLGEAAVCLAKGECKVAGGLWTPASALAPSLLTRLEENAGLSFTLLSAD